MLTDSQPGCIAIIGFGEVGETLAVGLKRAGATVIAVARSAARREHAQALGLMPESDLAQAAAAASVILIAVPGNALVPTMRSMATGLRPETLVIDLTSAPPEAVELAATLHPGGSERYVDGAIMGAISLQGTQVPMLLAGSAAKAAHDRLKALGLATRVLTKARIGDAARAKLLRSVFAKGLDALMVETALAAEAMGLSEEFQLQLDNFDRSPMRSHYEMYLSTHVRHAQRRAIEMEAAIEQLRELGIPGISASATLARYRRTVALAAAEASEGNRRLSPDANGATVLEWLLTAERRHQLAASHDDVPANRTPIDLSAQPATTGRAPVLQKATACLPPLESYPPRRLRPPPGAWDTHAHVIGSPSVYPFAAGRHFDPPEATATSFIDLLDCLGLAYGVVVQASVHGTDNRLLTEALLRHRDRLRGVAVVDDRIREAELLQLAEAGVTGVRLLDIVGGGVGMAKLERLASICAEMGWHLQLGLKGESFPAYAQRISALPVPVVIDHMGWCPATHGAQTQAFQTVKGLVRDHGCWVKLSGAFRLSGGGVPWADTWPMARALVEAAPDRMLWGSDWPHVGLYDPAKRPDTGALIDWLADVVPEPEMQARILADNPAILYGLPDGVVPAGRRRATAAIPASRPRRS